MTHWTETNLARAKDSRFYLTSTVSSKSFVSDCVFSLISPKTWQKCVSCSEGANHFSYSCRIGDRAFSVAAPRARNRLPTELKLLRSTDSFLRDLTTFCFILSTGTKIRINSVIMHPWSSIRGAIQVPQLQLQLQCNFLHFFKIARRFVRSYIQRPIFWPNFSHCRPMSGRVVWSLTAKLQRSKVFPLHYYTNDNTDLQLLNRERR